MLQACTTDLFRPIIDAARKGTFGPFGVIQGCLNTGDQERKQALAILEILGVTEEELATLIRGFAQYQANKRSPT